MGKDKRETESISRGNVLRKSEEVEGAIVKGYDFGNGVDYDKILDSYMATGFQATHFAKAVDIIRKMTAEKATIFLGASSNLITSGVRDVIRYLVEKKKIDVFVTTAGGIEEDIIKCLGDFKIGKFSESGELLRQEGINRTGNILIPNSRYVEFEKFLTPILNKIYEEQKKTGKIISVSEFIKMLGKKINNKESILYWAWKNDVKVFCPAITDGSMGDMMHFFMYKHPDFKVDIASDIHELNEFTITRKKTGLIILGKGMMKHHILNSNMMRNGADYAVYINSGEEWDGGGSNARPDEAVSWGKVGSDGKGEAIKVFGDATILFPLIVAKTFAGN
ncbi:MAG: deoxyhypusine synthase [Candidatus Pacearchaeota archaeon]